MRSWRRKDIGLRAVLELLQLKTQLVELLAGELGRLEAHPQKDSVDEVETTYVLDIGTPLTMVLAETTDGEDTIYYLHGLDLVAQSDGTSTEYFLYDALGSVRQLADDSASPLLTQTYDPYGTVYASVGVGASSYGFTGEQVDANGLVYLRTRYYQPGMGRFLTVDPSRLEVNPYLYTLGNPVNYVDPSGLIRWARSGSRYHMLVEDHYEEVPNNPIKHLEFWISAYRKRVDMFNSLTGDVYEVEPWYLAAHGIEEAEEYVDLLNAAGSANNLITSYNLPGYVMHYDWNSISFHLGTGLDWPGKMRVTMPGYTGYDLVADYSAPGLVVYWLEPKPNVPVYVLQRVPNKRLVRQRNWSPVSGYQPQPGYAITLNEACGYALISIGGTIILVTLVEDIATVGLGTIDDVVTLPAGYMLIDTGNRLAQYVPVSQQVPAY